VAIMLNVSDNESLNLTLIGSEEAVLLEADDSGVTLAAEESEEALLSVVEADEVTLEAEACIYIGGTGTPYTGAYEVTPKVEEQTLPTKERYMNDDVTVYGVPYFQTSNEYGDTVYIASEVI